MERSWFQRPRFVNARSRSSASESCEAIATRELDDMLNMFSSDDFLAILAFGDIEEALTRRKDTLRYIMLIWTIAILPAWCCLIYQSLATEKLEKLNKLFLHSLYLANPFFPRGGLNPFEAKSSTCFNTANSSASAARL